MNVNTLYKFGDKIIVRGEEKNNTIYPHLRVGNWHTNRTILFWKSRVVNYKEAERVFVECSKK